VSHDMRCALAIADRIIVLDQAKIVLDASPEQARLSALPLFREFLEEVR
jgi:phospholipid/cholesterol/gamma-HCH transport system ATP-binding protein